VSREISYINFVNWYRHWSLTETIRYPDYVLENITETEFHRARLEIDTEMWSERDGRRYRPYSLADPRTVVSNSDLFIEIHRDNSQWQRQWRRYAVNQYLQKK